LHIHTQWIRDIFNRLAFDVISEIYKHSGLRVYPEMCAINEWPIGGVQTPHNDSVSDVDIREGLIDETSREWTVILYINGHESYKGGETYFPNEGPAGQIMTPIRGTGIAFRGIDLEHGVYPVRRGARYTISQWYSSDKNRIITDERTKNLDLNHHSLRDSS
jgi:predicted 2-oxoglutarate/Fe(II)-dependent dioxygenase YbiX